MNNQAPIGTIIIYTGSKIPKGWMSCDGRRVSSNDLDRMTRDAVLSRNSYRKLKSILGDTYCLPKLQDKFIKGKQSINQTNQTGEASSHKHKVEIPEVKGAKTSKDGAHTHKFPQEWYKRGFTNPSGLTKERKGIDTGGGDIKYQELRSSGGHSHDVEVKITDAECGASGGLNRPAWYRVHFIMRVLL